MNNKIKSIALASAVTGGMLLSNCTLVKDLEYKVLEDPLEMHGDEVKLKMTATFVEKGLNKKAIVEVTPIFVCNDGTEIMFDSRTFQGEKAAGNGEVITKAGKTITYESMRPYQSCMEEGKVIVKILPKKGEKEKEVILTDKIADGTIITPYLIQLDDQVVACDDNFKRITTHTTDAVINYDKGKFNVKSAELKQEDIKAYEAFIIDAQTNVRREVKGVNIMSYASPEGEIDKNNNLAADRATSAEGYLTNFYKKAKLEMPAGLITKTPKGEDWDGFKTEVEKTTHEDKDLILRVLEMTSDLNKREEDIRNMAKTYTFLEKQVLPQLRRSQMILTYDKVGYSDDELKQLSKTNPDTLNVEELLYTAELVEDLNEKLRIYTEAERLFADDYRVVSNVGYILYLQNDIDGAKAKFEKAYGLQEDAIVANNLGAVAHMQGDRAKAKELFEKAGGPETEYNQGLIAIQEGMYGEALEKMGDNETFNVALAKVLNGEKEAAGSIIDASADADAAYSYYLKAIIAARGDNASDLVSNLTKAIGKDASYKAKAAKDAEFIKFRDNAEFKAVAGL